jgi:hypothetical protein
MEWPKWWQRRCRAVRERRSDGPYHGRCDLKAKHEGPHVLERGLEVVVWSTVDLYLETLDWGRQPPGNGRQKRQNLP